MQSVVLASSNVSDNESSLCHYRSVQRVRTARALAKSGHVVYAGLWAPDGNIRPFEESAQAFELNILSESSVSAAIHAAMKAPDGRLDTLIHNADHVAYGPAEAFTIQQFMDFITSIVSARSSSTR
jgi:NAD(P)-dependent dehydrogenase (short-subunit alcohol dehydrogenase family)